METYDEFGDLAGTGFENKEPVAPEDEMFHSIYIAGQMRKNHVNIMEKIGQLQIRGVEYNKDKVCMIVTHVKQILCNATMDTNKKETIHCFSYQEGEPPWIGTGGRECGKNSVERAARTECSACRAQLLVSGILCMENGKPILGEDNKPLFGFIRGKGMKYSNISDYLGDMSRLELDPIFSPVTEESSQFEKAVVNNKRFVTEITVTMAKSNYGDKMVFELTKGAQLPNNVVVDVLKIAKRTIGDFNKKFNWTKTKGSSTSSSSDESMQIPTTESKSEALSPLKDPPKDTKPKNDDIVSFDEVVF